MKDLVAVDSWAKLDVRVGAIVAATVPEGSEKLIQLTVDFGEEGTKTIFSGIKSWFTPEELVGTKRLFIINLEPKKTPFGMSEGMILGIDASENVVLPTVDPIVPSGSTVH